MTIETTIYVLASLTIGLLLGYAHGKTRGYRIGFKKGYDLARANQIMDSWKPMRPLRNKRGQFARRSPK